MNTTTREWTNAVLLSLEQHAKLWQYWDAAADIASRLTDDETFRRFGRTKKQLYSTADSLLDDYIKTPVKWLM